MRIINQPPRGIGKGTLELLRDRAAQLGQPIWDVIYLDDMGNLPQRSATVLRKFRDLIVGLQEASAELPLPAVLDRAADGALEVFDHAGLDEVVVDALAERVDGGLDGGVAGEDDGDDRGVALLQLVEQRAAVHVVHPEVGQDEVVVAAGGHLQRLAPVRGRRHVVALLFEDGGGRDAHVLLVVHDEDAGPARGAVPVRAAAVALPVSASSRHRCQKASASPRGG
jgi:hypothetical protein